MHKDNYKPDLSIIIPVWNEAAKTVNCLASIRANTKYPHEVIWIDNGSNDENFGTIKRQATRPNVHTKLIKLAQNVGFVKAINIGIKEAEKSSKYIILLNNDTEVSYCWAQKLLTPLQQDAKIGAVGPITQSKISWQEASHLNQRWNLKIPLFPKGGERKKNIHKYNEILTHKFKNKYISIDKLPLSFFCVALRKDTIDKVGLLDEDFGIGLGDDDEYCYRLRAHKFKLALSLETFVYHYHRTTFKTLKIPIDTLRRRNVKILRMKKKNITEKFA
jgi:O-antigen biosynthesis protein